MKSKVINILHDDGSVTAYRPLSQRLPAFLRHYSPEQGYAVIIEVQDTLSLRPGLRPLYEKAIEHGHKPEAVGLPPLTKEVVIQFQAKLLDAQERVLAIASAIKPIQEYKDYERGETAARQRLLAAMGFGGEVFDEDEQADHRAMGMTSAVAEATEQHEDTAGNVATTVQAVSTGLEMASSQDNGTAGVNAVPSAPTSDRTESVPTTPASQQQTDSSGPPPAALVRQITHLASMKQRDVPVYTTAAEAKVALKQLMQV